MTSHGVWNAIISTLPAEKCINLIKLEVAAYQNQTFILRFYSQPTPPWSLRCCFLHKLGFIARYFVKCNGLMKSTSQHREQPATKQWDGLTTGWRLHFSRKYSANLFCFPFLSRNNIATWSLQWLTAWNGYHVRKLLLSIVPSWRYKK